MMAAREVLFDRDLFIELGIVVDGPTNILSDSQSAVGMAFDPISFTRAGLNDPKYYKIANLILKGKTLKRNKPHCTVKVMANVNPLMSKCNLGHNVQ